MLHVYWPLNAFVTLFLVVGVIMLLLRYGPKLCKTRHNALPDDTEWRTKTYEHEMSYETEA